MSVLAASRMSFLLKPACPSISSLFLDGTLNAHANRIAQIKDDREAKEEKRVAIVRMCFQHFRTSIRDGHLPKLGLSTALEHPAKNPGGLVGV